MRPLFFLFLGFLFVNFAYSQQVIESANPKNTDDSTNPNTAEIVVQTSSEQLRDRKDNIFHTLSYVTTGNSFANIGNYISLGSSTEILKASLFFLPSERSLVNLSVTGGAAEGITALFDEGELNTNVSIGAEYQFMIGKYESASAEDIEDEYRTEEKAILDAYNEKLVGLAKSLTPAADKTKAYNTHDKKIESLDEFLEVYDAMSEDVYQNSVEENQKLFVAQVRKIRKKLIQDRFNSLSHLTNQLRDLYNKEENKVIKDSNKSLVESVAGPTNPKNVLDLQPALTKQIKEIDKFLEQYNKMSGLELSKLSEADQEFIKTLRSLKGELEANMNRSSREIIDEMKTLYVEERNTKIKALDDKYNPKFKPEIVNMQYIGVGYEATNKNFTQFIDSLSLPNQLTKRDYTSHTFQLSFNYLSNYRKKQRGLAALKFFSGGVRLSYTDNQGSLTQAEIVDTKIIGDDTGRSQITMQNAFIGDYQEEIGQIIFFADYITYLSPNRSSFGFRINPTLTVQENIKPNTSLQLGLIMPFKDKDKQKVITNLEVFYRIKDVFNTGQSANSLLNRNIIGIQTSFPFNL